MGDDTVSTAVNEATDDLSAWLDGPDPSRTNELGKWNVGQALPVFQVLFDLIEQVGTLEPALLSEPFREVVTQQLYTIRSQANAARSLDPMRSGNPETNRREFLKNTNEVALEAVRQLMPIVTLFGSPAAQVFEQARMRADVFLASVQEDLKAVNEAKKQAELALASVKEVAAGAGVSAHATHFRNQSNEHLRASKTWLGVTSALFAAVLGFAVWSFAYHWNHPATGESLDGQLIASKVILFGVLLSALVASNRNYRTHRHNYVVNKHRENALASFQTFVAGSDASVRSAVLLQATTSIFSPQVTGYVSQERDNEGLPQLMAALKGFTDGRPQP